MAGSVLTLLVPGLFTKFPGLDPALVPAVPALSTLLARSHKRVASADCPEATLCQLFNLSDTDDELPVAWYSWCADFGRPPEQAVVRSDPVFLRADTSELRLFAAASQSLTLSEAEQLVASLNEHVAADGLRFIAATATRWYLQSEKPVHLRSLPISKVAGQDIRSFLPTGEDAARWRRLLNELQMLLHSHPLIQQYQSQRQVKINSVWFWGAGNRSANKPGWQGRVFSDDRFCQGLAEQAGCSHAPFPKQLDSSVLPEQPEKSLLMFCQWLQTPAACTDDAAWLEQLGRLEKAFFVPLLSLLKSGKLAALALTDGQGTEYRITRVQSWKVWQRARPFKTG